MNFPPKEHSELVSFSTTASGTSVLRCPICQNILYDFGQLLDPVTLRKVVTRDAESLYRIARYCPQCGQKLQYEREVAIEEDSEVIKDESVYN